MSNFFRRIVRLLSGGSPIEFTITDAAREQLQRALASRSKRARVCLSVYVNDPRFEVSFHYDMQIEDNPDEREFEFCRKNGIRVAIRRTDIRRLVGARLDYQVFGKHGGFIFDNPNAPEDVLSHAPDV